MSSNGLGSLSGILARAESRMWADFSDAWAFDNTGDIGKRENERLLGFCPKGGPHDTRLLAAR